MNNEEKFLLGALVGGAIGAATALILAPMTGKNLRDKIVKGLSTDLQRLGKNVHGPLVSKKRTRPKSAKEKAEHPEHPGIKRKRRRREKRHMDRPPTEH